MARIDRHLRWLWTAAAVLAAAGCDPYPTRNTAAPEVQVVYASDGDPYNPQEFEGTKTDTGWTITIPSLPDETDPTIIRAVAPVIIVQTNQSLDDASIQTAFPTIANPDGDCTPMNGWLTVTPAPTGDDHWYSCYQPSAAVSFEGGAVVLFKAASPIIAGSEGIGWYELATLEAQSTEPDYTLNGVVRDRSGRELTISVTVIIEPLP